MSCPVCFNAATSDDTVRQSLNMGIFVLLGVTTIVLGGFIRFIVGIVRRSASARAEAGTALTGSLRGAGLETSAAIVES